jgi:hypothetical protein
MEKCSTRQYLATTCPPNVAAPMRRKKKKKKKNNDFLCVRAGQAEKEENMIMINNRLIDSYFKFITFRIGFERSAQLAQSLHITAHTKRHEHKIAIFFFLFFFSFCAYVLKSDAVSNFAFDIVTIAFCEVFTANLPASFAASMPACNCWLTVKKINKRIFFKKGKKISQKKKRQTWRGSFFSKKKKKKKKKF